MTKPFGFLVALQSLLSVRLDAFEQKLDFKGTTKCNLNQDYESGHQYTDFMGV